ncbi:MAG: adenylate/guanylate cyclase domain-containing protein [Candidatus Wallbacteria bacterium]|nr:adenylate/guanylate cyclase domain-containing protein [Candidatus Wallbacteria bacterium]
MRDKLQAENGKLTFLFTDIEGSTRKWEQHPEAMKTALELHDSILSEEIKGSDGNVFKTVGDAFCATFKSPIHAARAAESFQKRLAGESWGETGEIRVRCAIHSGPAVERSGDYFGPTVNRVARILATGHGGQVLLSSTSAVSLESETDLISLGEHRLKDLEKPEQIYQLSSKGLKHDFPPLKSLNRFQHNLPVQHTSFIGRTEEKEKIRQLFSENCIVTLKGFGGCGKTRLALHSAAEMFDRFPDGIFFAELNTLNSKQEILDRLCEIFNLQIQKNVPELNQIIRHLKELKLLLIFDNCEHLIDAAAEVISSIAAGASAVRLMATSRESLRIDGECIVEILPLATASGQAESEPAESVLLFMDRFQKKKELIDRDQELIERICSKLDGIPLAIELAAGLTSSLPLSEIAARLDERFSLLKSGKRGAPLQHRTLRAAIDWSYDRLSDPEKMLLRMVSALKCEWVLESVERIACSAGSRSDEVLHLHSSLVEKSLILPLQDGRFHLLETVREYAKEKLLESGEMPFVFKCISEHYLALAETTSLRIFGDHRTAVKTFRAESCNFLAVADELDSHHDQSSAEQLARLILALYEYWHTTGMELEASARFKLALNKREQLPEQMLAELLMKRARNLNSLGLYEEGEKTSLESIAISEGKFPVLCAWAHLTAGVSYILRKDYVNAKKHYEISRPLFEASGDLIGLAGILGNLGGLFTETGELEPVEKLLLRSCEIYRQAGESRRLAFAIVNLGDLYLARNDLLKAEQKYREAIAQLEQNGWHGHLDIGYGQLGKLAELKGEHATALSCFITSLKSILHNQCPLICSEYLQKSAYSLLKLGRIYECGVLLGVAAAAEKSMFGTEIEPFVEKWLQSRGEKSDSIDGLRKGFDYGLGLRLKDVEGFLEKQQLIPATQT